MTDQYDFMLFIFGVQSFVMCYWYLVFNHC